MTQVAAPAQKSTIVRMFSAPWPVRAMFWSLDRVAPAVGARWAERVWFTLPRPRPDASVASREPLIGTPFTTKVDGHHVRGESWGHGPTVYLLHGWAGHRRQLIPFVANRRCRNENAVIATGNPDTKNTADRIGSSRATLTAPTNRANAVSSTSK